MDPMTDPARTTDADAKAQRLAARERRLALNRQIDRLLEDEGLRSNLDDAQAEPLLAWGTTWLEAAAETPAGAPAHLERLTEQVRLILHQVNAIVGRQAADPQPATLRYRLNRLLGRLRLLPAAAVDAQLVARALTLDGQAASPAELADALCALLNTAAPAPAATEQE